MSMCKPPGRFSAMGDVTAETVCGRVFLARGERGWRQRPPEEQRVQEEDRVGESQLAVVVTVAGAATSQEFALTQEKTGKQGDRIHYVEFSVTVTLAPDEERSEFDATARLETGPLLHHSGKAQIVSQYPAGKNAVCFVNPEKPSEAVLKTDLGWGVLLVLFPLVFMAVGFFGIYFTVFGRRKSSRRWKRST